MKRILLTIAFAATVVGANWAIDRYGVVAIGFGLTAPAGVFFAGLAFGLRDALHEVGGARSVIVAIIIGGILSYVVGDAITIPGGLMPLAIASMIAFTISELADLAIYAPIRERNWPIAVIASNVVAAIADSALFLWLAFGSLDYMLGQIVGKSYMIAVALPVVWFIRRQETTS